MYIVLIHKIKTIFNYRAIAAFPQLFPLPFAFLLLRVLFQSQSPPSSSLQLKQNILHLDNLLTAFVTSQYAAQSYIKVS